MSASVRAESHVTTGASNVRIFHRSHQLHAPQAIQPFASAVMNIHVAWRAYKYIPQQILIVHTYKPDTKNSYRKSQQSLQRLPQFPDKLMETTIVPQGRLLFSVNAA
jgi:hypothetical protein